MGLFSFKSSNLEGDTDIENTSGPNYSFCLISKKMSSIWLGFFAYVCCKYPTYMFLRMISKYRLLIATLANYFSLFSPTKLILRTKICITVSKI